MSAVSVYPASDDSMTSGAIQYGVPTNVRRRKPSVPVSCPDTPKSLILTRAAAAQQHVGRLDVAVHALLGVQVRQRRQHAAQHVRQRSPRPAARVQLQRGQGLGLI